MMLTGLPRFVARALLLSQHQQSDLHSFISPFLWGSSSGESASSSESHDPTLYLRQVDCETNDAIIMLLVYKGREREREVEGEETERGGGGGRRERQTETERGEGAIGRRGTRRMRETARWIYG